MELDFQKENKRLDEKIKLKCLFFRDFQVFLKVDLRCTGLDLNWLRGCKKPHKIVDTFFGGTHKFAVHISEFEHRINDPLGFWIEN